MKTLKTIRLYLLVLILLCNVILVNSGPISWKFTTDGLIESSPVADDSVIYFGSSDGYLYAINSDSGKQYWKYNTAYPVSSTPLVADSLVYITSANTLFAVNKYSGVKSWQYTPEESSGKIPTIKKDEWDYHHSSPYWYEGRIYYGDEYGNIHGINAATGISEFKYTTSGKATIRTTVTISNDTLYFGDWNGFIYAIDINDSSLLWSYKTYQTKPYYSFGPVITQPTIYHGKVYVGLRNHKFTVVNADSGTYAWSYTDPSDGWMSGIPCVVNDTLYIGSSDSKKLYVFNPDNGNIYWICKTMLNISGKPVVRQNYVFFGDGDSNSHSFGKGYFYCVNTKTGVPKNIIAIGRNIFSSTLLNNNHLYFGCYDKSLYCIDIDQFLNADSSSLSFSLPVPDTLEVQQGITASYSFSILNTGNCIDSVEVSIQPETFEQNGSANLSKENILAIPQDIQSIWLSINAADLIEGIYDITITATSKKDPEQTVSSASKLVIYNSASSLNDVNNKGEFNIYPNPARDFLNVVSLSGTKVSQYKIYNVSGKLERCIVTEDLPAENNYQINLNGLSSGLYFLSVITSKGAHLIKFTVEE